MISAVSGGVDSSVATALVQRAVGDQLSTVFIDTGLLRLNEVTQVRSAFKGALGMELTTIDASETYFDALKGVTDPELSARSSVNCSSASSKVRLPGWKSPIPGAGDNLSGCGGSSERFRKGRSIKSHHNVGGLPKD